MMFNCIYDDDWCTKMMITMTMIMMRTITIWSDSYHQWPAPLLHTQHHFHSCTFIQRMVMMMTIEKQEDDDDLIKGHQGDYISRHLLSTVAHNWLCQLYSQLLSLRFSAWLYVAQWLSSRQLDKCINQGLYVCQLVTTVLLKCIYF